MDRRTFLKSIAVMGCGWRLTVTDEEPLAFTSERRYGMLTAEDTGGVEHITVWFNDTDVTGYCWAFDDGEGWVELYPIDPISGRITSATLKRFYGAVRAEIDW